MDPSTDLTIGISSDEWRVAAQLVPFTSGDERDVLGMLRLVAREGRRVWWATDMYRLATEIGGSEAREYDVLVSPRLVSFALAESSDQRDATLTVASDEHGVVVRATVRRGDASLSLAADPRPFPAVEEILRDSAERASDAPSVVVDAGEFRALANQAAWRALPDDVEGDDDPLLWLGVDEGELSVSMDWADLGATMYSIRGEGRGSAAMAVPPGQLARASAGFENAVTITVPRHADPLRLTDGQRVILIMPIDPTFEARDRVESIMADVFGSHALERDADGDYPLTVAGIPVYGRFVPGEPSLLQVFAVVLNDVESNPELLAELNDHNASLRFVRTFWVQHQILVESDLVADTLDRQELAAAFEACRQAAENLGPLLAAVYGGDSPGRSINERWAAYRETIIEADLTPGTTVTLNGPNAAQPWPLPGRVWVITADNPFGRRLPEDVNAGENAQLASALVGSGKGFIGAAGRAADGTYREVSMLVWDIDRPTARELGRQFGQETIFELDAEQVRVVGCFSDRIDTQPRAEHASN